MLPTKYRAKSAFTLIEIIVVVAIIALLLFILLPIVTRTLYSSGQTSDMSTLRNLWFAHHQFSTDHDNFMVIGLDRRNFFNKNPRTDKFMSWMELLRPYLKSESQGTQNQDLVSPADPTKGGAERLGQHKTHRSYGINSRTEWGEAPINASLIARPDIFVIIGNYDISLAGDSANINGGLSGGSNSLNRVPVNWYGNGTANFLFLDGHVEAIAVADIMPGMSRYHHFNRELNRPANRDRIESGF